MTISDERLRELAEQMATAMGMTPEKGRPTLSVVRGKGRQSDVGRPSLRLVKPAPARPPDGMDPIARESHLRMIRSLKKGYRQFGMDLIVNQATLGKGSIEDLCDDELMQLHRDMDKALDCIRNDVSFEDAGLLRPANPEAACWG